MTAITSFYNAIETCWLVFAIEEGRVDFRDVVLTNYFGEIDRFSAKMLQLGCLLDPKQILEVCLLLLLLKLFGDG